MAKILITTGIYPPKIGGPAQYAKNLKLAFESQGNTIAVKTYNLENYLPTGFRHAYFFLKIIPKILSSDWVLALDTFSVGLPTVLASKIFRKKCLIRTGGDFLWEQYVERTGKKIMFRNFYKEELERLSIKEKIIFNLTQWTLNKADGIVFSTDWQREIFISAYNLKEDKTFVVENYYGSKEGIFEPNSKVFVASTRILKWKNLDTIKKVWNRIKTSYPDAELFTKNLPYPKFMEKIKHSYAIVQVSLGDISPNMILDAIRYNKPFICTKEIGIYDRIRDIGIFVNPLNEEEIENAILKLLDPEEYKRVIDKIKQFNFTHTWQEMAGEFIDIYKNLK